VATYPSVGLALSTIGRPGLKELLESAAESSRLPAAVAVADHTPHQDLRIDDKYPFPVLITSSVGGVARGRNDAVAALSPWCEVIGFPNDDCRLPPTTIEQVGRAFAGHHEATVVAGTLVDATGPRMRLPRSGTILNRRSVWRAIEPAMWVRRDAYLAAGGLRDDLGTGSDSPWQSGDGTDLLLRIMASGGTVCSRPEIIVLGRGERRDLAPSAFVAKHRAYARGTGYVYRLHSYPLHDRVRLVVAPLVKVALHDASFALSARIAAARATGRVEGLLGRPLTTKHLTWL